MNRTRASGVRKGLISVPEAAAWLGMHRSTAHKLIESGDFPVPVVRMGSIRRVRVADLERFLNGEEAAS